MKGEQPRVSEIEKTRSRGCCQADAEVMMCSSNPNLGLELDAFAFVLGLTWGWDRGTQASYVLAVNILDAMFS